MLLILATLPACSEALAAGPAPESGDLSQSGDPLLFRHRFQHHDVGTGRLLYYEYAARRHSHVVPLTDLGIESCHVKAHPRLENHTFLTLVTRHAHAAGNAANLSQGAIVVGHEIECSSEDGRLSRGSIRERVVATPKVSQTAQGGMQWELILTPAGIHECFEHATIEYFRGAPHSLHTARDARLASLASSHQVAPPHSFATTEDIIADAVRVSRRLQGTVNDSTRRQLTHWRPRTYSMEIGEIRMYGTECTGGDSVDGSLLARPNCFWQRSGNTIALRVGNTITIRWKSVISADVKISIWEDDDIFPDWCHDLTTRRSHKYTGSVYNSPNEYTFTIPDLSSCAGGLLEGYPEYRIWIEEREYTIGYKHSSSSSLFRLVTGGELTGDYNINLNDADFRAAL